MYFFLCVFFYFSFISKISSTLLLSSLDIFSYSRLIPFFTQFFHLNNVHRGRMGMNERDIELLSSPNEFRSVHFRFTKIYECNVIERCSLSSSMMCSLVWLLLLFSFFWLAHKVLCNSNRVATLELRSALYLFIIQARAHEK